MDVYIPFVLVDVKVDSDFLGIYFSRVLVIYP